MPHSELYETSPEKSVTNVRKLENAGDGKPAHAQRLAEFILWELLY